VIAKDEASGEKRLLAFVVVNRKFDEDALSDFLKTKLPEYMVPSAFIQLETLPLTINGKVDRKALSSCAPAPPSDVNHAAPRNAIEEALASIWSEVLHVSSVGVNDNFFDLGGDSILGTLILARAARAGFKISPTQLFEHQTIAELAAVAAGSLQIAAA
jgi:acyl carrier protein